jgi:hypothetical protein
MTDRTRYIIIAILTAIALAALIFGVKSCSDRNTTKTQVRIEKGQAGAAINAGAEAGNTITAITGNDIATDRTVQGGINDIRNASPDDRGLAAQRAACRLRNRSGDQRCAALRTADPKHADAPR